MEIPENINLTSAYDDIKRKGYGTVSNEVASKSVDGADYLFNDPIAQATYEPDTFEGFGSAVATGLEVGSINIAQAAGKYSGLMSEETQRSLGEKTEAMKADQRTWGTAARIAEPFAEFIPSMTFAAAITPFAEAATIGATARVGASYLLGETSAIGSAIANIAPKIASPLLQGTSIFASQSTGEYYQLKAKGIEDKTAKDLSYTDGVISAIGAIMPAAFGKTLVQKIATGAASNIVIGGFNRSADSSILKKNGYDNMAEQYKVLDFDSFVAEGLIGAAFGGFSYLGHHEGEIKPIQKTKIEKTEEPKEVLETKVDLGDFDQSNISKKYEQNEPVIGYGEVKPTPTHGEKVKLKMSEESPEKVKRYDDLTSQKEELGTKIREESNKHAEEPKTPFDAKIKNTERDVERFTKGGNKEKIQSAKDKLEAFNESKNNWLKEHGVPEAVKGMMEKYQAIDNELRDMSEEISSIKRRAGSLVSQQEAENLYKIPPELIDSSFTAINNHNVLLDSAPGIPVDIASRNFHLGAFKKTWDALVGYERLPDLSKIEGYSEAKFLNRKYNRDNIDVAKDGVGYSEPDIKHINAEEVSVKGIDEDSMIRQTVDAYIGNKKKPSKPKSEAVKPIEEERINKLLEKYGDYEVASKDDNGDLAPSITAKEIFKNIKSDVENAETNRKLLELLGLCEIGE